MAYSAKAVANTIIELALQQGIHDVSPMKLQKLLFYVQSWYLRLYNQKLFNDPIERWDYGPVVRDVYNEFRTFGYSPITKCATDALGFTPIVQTSDSKTRDLINRVIEVYGQFSAYQLSNMTHAPGGAWSRNKEPIISDQDLCEGEV